MSHDYQTQQSECKVCRTAVAALRIVAAVAECTNSAEKLKNNVDLLIKCYNAERIKCFDLEKILADEKSKRESIETKFLSLKKELNHDLENLDLELQEEKLNIDYETAEPELDQSKEAKLERKMERNALDAPPKRVTTANHDLCDYEPLPESLIEKWSRVKAAGGIMELERMLDGLDGLLRENREILDETICLLNEEKQFDAQLRAQFKQKWTRVSSDKLTKRLHQEVAEYRTILETAIKADAIVKQKFEANKKGIEMLSKPEPELRAAVPSLSKSSANTDVTVVAQLKDLMQEVTQIKTDREIVDKKLKETEQDDMAPEFVKALADSNTIDEESLSKDGLNRSFGSLLLEKIQTANRRNNLSKENSALGLGARRERETVLRTLHTASDAYLEIRVNLQEGTEFYNELTPMLVKLQRKVADFVFARKTEKDNLVQSSKSLDSICG